MSVFSEKLKELIRESGMSVAQLAKQCGIDRTTLFKTQQGKRLPEDTEKIELLLHTMSCSQDDTREILEQFRSEKLGMHRYECMQEFFEMLQMLDATPVIRIKKTISTEDIPTMIDGTKNVNIAVRVVMEKEAAIKGGRIRLMLPVSYNYGMECIASVLHGCSDEFQGINHLITLASTVKDDAMLQNMQTLKRIIPFTLTENHYEAEYFYAPGGNKIQFHAGLFPWYIICTHGVLQIADDYKKAVFIKDESIIEGCIEKFDEKQKAGKKLLYHLPTNILLYIEQFGEVIKKTENKKISIMSLSSGICLIPFLSEDIVEKYIPKEVKNSSENKDIVTAYFSQFKNNKSVTIAQKKGVENFLKTGKLNEFPFSDELVIEPEDRIAVIEELIRQTEAEETEFYIFRHTIFPDNCRCSITKWDRQIFIEGEKFDKEQVGIVIKERSLENVLTSYVYSAEKLSYTYSTAESVRMVKDILEEYKAEKN